MRHRIAHHSQSDRRMSPARRFAPTLQLRKSVRIFRQFRFHVPIALLPGLNYVFGNSSRVVVTPSCARIRSNRLSTRFLPMTSSM